MLPPTFHRGRVALTFFVLRPFAMLPTLWNRLLGAAVILPRLRLQGRAAYTNPPGSTAAGEKPKRAGYVVARQPGIVPAATPRLMNDFSFGNVNDRAP